MIYAMYSICMQQFCMSISMAVLAVHCASRYQVTYGRSTANATDLIRGAGLSLCLSVSVSLSLSLSVSLSLSDSLTLIRWAECWDFFVEYVIANDEHSAGEQGLAARYQAGLLAVMEGAISRLLHVSNAEMLEELLEDESNGGSAGLGLGDDRLEEGGAEEEEDAEGEAGALQSESSQLVR